MMKVFLVGAAAFAAGSAAIAQAPPATQAPPAAHQGPRVHAMQKAVTRDEVVSRVRDIFARLDMNRDGFITREEAQAGRQRVAGDVRDRVAKRLAERGSQRPDRGAIFDRLDTNRDGAISRQEFMAARAAGEKRVMIMRSGADGQFKRMRGMGIGMGFGGRMFDMADANRDGRVSLAEAQTTALAHFDRADVNRDGRITPEERQQARQALRAQRRPS